MNRRVDLVVVGSAPAEAAVSREAASLKPEAGVEKQEKQSRE